MSFEVAPAVLALALVRSVALGGIEDNRRELDACKLNDVLAKMIERVLKAYR